MLRAIVGSSSGGGGGGSVPSVYLVQDQKSNGTGGGTFTTGAWRTRDLNTEVISEITGASLSANQVSLPAGTYEFIFYAPAYGVSGHISRLYNATAGAAISIPSHNATSVNQISYAVVLGKFTIASDSRFEVQHQSTGTLATFGFGLPMALGQNEVYTQILFRKVA